MVKLSFSKTWKEALNLETKKKVYGFIYQKIYFLKIKAPYSRRHVQQTELKN